MRHVGIPTMSEDGVYARWPVSHRPFALFGKPYVWIREAKTADVIADPDFDYRRLPLVLVKVPDFRAPDPRLEAAAEDLARSADWPVSVARQAIENVTSAYGVR